MTKKNAIWHIVHDTWELSNKPNRFFSSLRTIIKEFHNCPPGIMSSSALAGGLKETLEQVDLLEKAFYEFDKNS